MRFVFPFFLILLFPMATWAQMPDRIVALGDSLTAGYGLPSGEDFATKLEHALNIEGHNVRIENAGVSGNTTQQGLERLEQAIAGEQKPRLVIVALGANDMLRKMDVGIPRDNLVQILNVLKARDIPVFLIGIHRLSSTTPFFSDPYKKMYKELAKDYDVPLYPFFLKDVALKRDLNLSDGLHPNAKGIDVMVENILPEIEDALRK